MKIYVSCFINENRFSFTKVNEVSTLSPSNNRNWSLYVQTEYFRHTGVRNASVDSGT